MDHDGRGVLVKTSLAAAGQILCPRRVLHHILGQFAEIIGGQARDDFDDSITFEQATSKLWLYPLTSEGTLGKRVEIGIGAAG